MAPAEKNIGGQSVTPVYDVTNQIFECDTHKPTDIATSEWLVHAYLDAQWTNVQLYTSCLARDEQTFQRKGFLQNLCR